MVALRTEEQGVPASEPAVQDGGRRVRPYDFQRQEALDRGRLRRLEPVLEVMAHRMAGALTSTLRLASKVEVGELDQQRWEHYAASLPEPTFLCSATVVPYGGRIVLHLPLPLALTAVELRMGGTGRPAPEPRALTEIEQRLVSDVAQRMLAELPPAFAPVLNVSIGALSSVASSMFLQAVKPTEMCLIVALRVVLGDLDGAAASLCVPISVLLPILDALERLDQTEGGESHADASQVRLRERLLEVPLEVVVCFPDIFLPPEELLGLRPGDVVPLHREVDKALQLRAEGEPYRSVRLTARGKRLAAVVVEDEEREA
jgi:flagellar motor switch protein FliM